MSNDQPPPEDTRQLHRADQSRSVGELAEYYDEWVADYERLFLPPQNLAASLESLQGRCRMLFHQASIGERLKKHPAAPAPV